MHPILWSEKTSMVRDRIVLSDFSLIHFQVFFVSWMTWTNIPSLIMTQLPVQLPGNVEQLWIS